MITKEEFESLVPGDEIILKSAEECERIMTQDKDAWNIDMNQYCKGRVIHFKEFIKMDQPSFLIQEDWYYFFWETIESILKYSPKPDKESIIIPTTSLF